MDEYGSIIIDALTKIAYQSVMLKELNDGIGGELSRVMNSYSEIINSDQCCDNDKNVWNKAYLILKYCDVVNEDLRSYSAMI